MSGFFLAYSTLSIEPTHSSETPVDLQKTTRRCIPADRTLRISTAVNLKYNGSVITDMINLLPGNSSVNMVQHPTIEEAVFSVSAVTSRSDEWWSRDMCSMCCVSVPRLYKWQHSFCSGTGDSHGTFVAEEANKKWACEDLTSDLKTLCVLQHSGIWCGWFSETFIVQMTEKISVEWL
jgi:hypothetical protein